MLIFKSSEKILLQSYRQKVKKQKDFEFYWKVQKFSASDVFPINLLTTFLFFVYFTLTVLKPD